MITQSDLQSALRALDLSGKPVCVHVSLRSFGERVEAQTLIDAFLAENCTILVPAFTWAYQVPPPEGDRPARNAIDYANLPAAWFTQRDSRYTPATNAIEGDWGTFPVVVVNTAGRVRGGNPIDSFVALGRQAHELVGDQTPLDVYAPLRNLAALGGAVLLIGVGYTRMTLIHAAEKQAGRRMFRRWANDADGKVIQVEQGSCSEGFDHLAPYLDPLMREITVGQSRWRAYPARAALDAAADAIRANPALTHCDNPNCIECNDMQLGGFLP